MNKHQYALDNIGSTYFSMNYVANEKLRLEFEKMYNEYKQTLQELVDKATPKKPIREIWGWDCPNCGNYVAYYPKKANGTDQNDVYVFLETCPNHDCRQAIDWSNDES